MLKNITLGQYYPVDSAMHRLDPRAKLVMSLVYIIVVFNAADYLSYALLALFTGFVIMMSHVPFKMILRSLKSVLVFIIITAVLNMLFTPGQPVFEYYFIRVTREGIVFAVMMVLRIFFLLVGTSILTLTTSPIALTDAIERLLSPLKRIKVPAHEIAMMMTIALRFIPTLLEETDKIMKAQKARGADFESGNVFKRAKAMAPLLVPLFISAFRRADELAVAMESRCYRGGENRTRMHVLHMTKADYRGIYVFAFFCACMIALRIWQLLL